MQCADYLFGICLVAAKGAASLFGFKDFIAALALLVIVYTRALRSGAFASRLAEEGLDGSDDTLNRVHIAVASGAQRAISSSKDC